MKKISFLIIITLLINSLLHADTPTAQFLLISQGARAEAMGGSGVSNCNDHTTMYWNPAFLPFLTQGEAGFSYTSLSENISNNYFAIAYPYKNFGFGFNLISQTSKMNFYDSLGNSSGLGKAEDSLNYNISLGFKISHFFSIGTTIGKINIKLYNEPDKNPYQAEAFTSNIGALYNNTNFFLGVTLANLGESLKFIDTKEKLPELLRLGISYSILKNRNLLLSYSYTRVFEDTNANNSAFGIEHVLQKKLALRAGYKIRKSGGSFPSFGIGIINKKIIFNYSFTIAPGALSGLNTHKAGFSFKFGRKNYPVIFAQDTMAPEIVVQYLKHNNKTLEPKDQKIYSPGIDIIGRILSDQNTLLDTFFIKCNGKKIVKKTDIGEQKYSINEKIKLKEGINKLEITAIDINNKESIYKELNIIYEKNILKGKAPSIEDFVDYVSSKGTNWAVLIGIDSYPNESGFKSLDYVVNDILSLKECLLKNVQNFDERNIFTLGEGIYDLNDKTNYIGDATKHNIEEFLGDELPSKIKDNDKVLIFFSGHGVTLDTITNRKKQGFLAPVDGKKDKPFSTCVSMDIINQLSERIPAKQILFVIDTCNSGLVLVRNKGEKHQKNLKKRIESFLSDSRQALTAGKSAQVSQISTEYEQSIYTYYLTKGLTGKADSDKDGIVSVHELHAYVRGKVSSHTNNKQIPQIGRLKEGGEGDFFFILK